MTLLIITVANDYQNHLNVALLIIIIIANDYQDQLNMTLLIIIANDYQSQLNVALIIIANDYPADFQLNLPLMNAHPHCK